MNTATRRLPLLLLAACLCFGLGRLGAAPAADRVEIRGADGQVMIGADQIRSYDWSTHTITLGLGLREQLVQRLLKGGRLASGVPFAMVVGGETLYRGVFTSALSSQSQSVPVILTDPSADESKFGPSELRIQLGYPTAKFFKGEDPRPAPRLRTALTASGKLVLNPNDRSEWVARALREMETVKPGMTRAELLKVFQEEGGLSNRKHRRYAYRDCEYMKVNVTFQPVGRPDDLLFESPKDKIVQISTPFLEWQIDD